MGLWYQDNWDQGSFIYKKKCFLKERQWFQFYRVFFFFFLSYHNCTISNHYIIFQHKANRHAWFYLPWKHLHTLKTKSPFIWQNIFNLYVRENLKICASRFTKLLIELKKGRKIPEEQSNSLIENKLSSG